MADANIQHCWRPVEPGSEELVPFCEDPTVIRHADDHTITLPICPICHRLAIQQARKEEWDKVTSPEAVNIFKVGWHIGRRHGEPKTLKGLQRVRELLGR